MSATNSTVTPGACLLTAEELASWAPSGTERPFNDPNRGRSSLARDICLPWSDIYSTDVCLPAEWEWRRSFAIMPAARLPIHAVAMSRLSQQ